MTHRAVADRRWKWKGGPASWPVAAGRAVVSVFCPVVCLAIGVGAVSLAGFVRAADPAPVASLELADGSSVSGRIERLTDAAVDLVVDEKPRSIGIREVRAIGWQPAEPGPARTWPVGVRFVDGSVLAGDDLTLSEKNATVVRGGRSIAVPLEAIADADFAAAAPDVGIPAAQRPAPAWIAKLQEGGQDRAAGSDLVVVGSGESPEFVECAIVAVAADAVTVLLDDEMVRVKRAKVIGLKWLRQPERDAPRGGEGPRATAAVVELDGGRLLARRVAIEGDTATIDLGAAAPVRVPAESLRRVDFGAGRTVSLVSLESERVEVEPWFGIFASLDGIAAHFRPRPVTVPGVAGERPRQGLRVRPRTVMEWRLPEHARKLAMTLSESSSLVTVAVDGREAYRGQPSAGTPVAADVAGGRRLTVTVDFPPTGPGTGGTRPSPVVLIDPRIER